MLNLNASDTLADYGCGDGPALLYAARTIGCKCVGYEIHEERARFLQSTVAADGSIALLVQVHARNALDAESSDGVTAVYLYLIERGLQLIMPLLRRLAGQNGGSLRVVTVLYRIPGVPHVRVDKVAVSELVRTPVYLYTITPLSGLAVEEPATSTETAQT
jgi:hypothetical protein